MMTLEQVETLRRQLESEGAPAPEIIRQVALNCLGWPYVFGAWGEQCTPAGRRRRARSDHPTIISRCPALSSGVLKAEACHDCKWGIGVRMYDCRGFTCWLVRQVGLDLTGQGATSQYNAAGNWVRRGTIDGMPDCVCCVFRQKDGKMEHTGMHVGGGLIVHCSVNVQTATLDKSWTHFGIPFGLYSEEEIPTTTVKPTIRRGSRGDLVRELQDTLETLGYDPGGIDGIFGVKTYNALVRFQTDAKLDPDGVCGPKTWAALYTAECQMPPAPGAPQLYRVTCEGVSWDQYKRILEICPLAEAEKE